MYHLKSVYLYQTATVNKLLKEGWEPFWGYKCQHKEHDTVRMYFKKLEGTLLPVSKVEKTKPRTMEMKIEVDRRELDSVLNDVAMITGALAEGVTNLRLIQEAQEYLESMKIHKPKSFIENLPEHIELDEDEEEIQALQESEQKDLDELELDEEEDLEFDNARKAGEAPAGDSYRVVEDIPDEVKAQLGSHIKTEAQEKTIDFIRSESDINITVHPIREDGIIIVTRGTTIFAIAPDGTTVEQETNANTQALG